MRKLCFIVIVALLATKFARAETAISLPPPIYDPAPATSSMQKIIVAGGCFWGVQGVFQHVVGVSRVVSGYAGGDKSTAQYTRVSQGDTGHAEAVEITYDPRRVSLGALLRVFFSVAHAPTQRDRQGPDTGTQYRSAVFVSDETQAKIVREYIAQLGASNIFAAPIVTRIETPARFYPAEPYHQDYLIRHPDAPYVAFNDLPKIENLRTVYPALWRATPARDPGAAAQDANFRRSSQ
jgi:peptide-methionine (S)-S-oxide reductase